MIADMSPSTAISGEAGVGRAVVSDHVTHELKSWPEFFDSIISGDKTHDLRRADDRQFSVGDRLRLREFDPKSERYSGRECTVEVTYITSTKMPCAYFDAAVDPRYCILSIRIV